MDLKTVFLFFYFFHAFVGCSYHYDKAGIEENGGKSELETLPQTSGEGTGSNKGNLSYTLVRAQVFAPYCLKCHANKSASNVSLQTYASTKQSLTEIFQAVVVEKTMPKGKSLTAEQRKLVESWINAGAPEFISSPIIEESTP